MKDRRKKVILGMCLQNFSIGDKPGALVVRVDEVSKKHYIISARAICKALCFENLDDYKKSLEAQLADSVREFERNERERLLSFFNAAKKQWEADQ